MGKDIQRAFLWVILFTSCFLLWDNYQVYRGGESFFQKSEPAAEQKADAAASTPDAVPSDKPAEKPAASTDIAASKLDQAKDPVVVTTDRMKVTFDREGAVIIGNEMRLIPRQADWTEVGLAGLILGRKAPEHLGNVNLLEENAKRTYVAQSGLVGGSFPNHRDPFRLVSSKLDMGDAQNLDVVFESEKSGVTVRKTYTFERGNYGVTLKTEVVNGGSEPVKPSVYYQITRDDGAPEDESSMYSTFTGPAVYSDQEKFQKIQFKDIADKSASYEKNADNGWIAMVQHHFVSAWIPKQGEKRENYTRQLDTHLYSVGTLISLGTVEPGKSVSDTALLYSGPQDQNRLKQLAPGLELVVDYGWLTFLAKPIYWLLSFLYSLVHNWGWAIVLLTCIVKAILYPVSAAGYRSMARLKDVTPRLKMLQDKYKDDKERLNRAVMELYRTEKINPIGGCLPILLQIPVFLALYWVLQGSVELRGSEWILWVHDLAMPDPWFVLPLLMTVTMFIQILLNPKPTDPMQAKITYIMPLVFSVMFFFFASGLVLYWLTNNVLSIWQQWYINKTIAAERAKRMAANNR